MIRQDTIRVTGTQLHIRFASALDPAGLNVLSLANGLALRRQERSVVAGFDGATNVLGTFANERQAEDALDAIHRTLQRHARREGLLRWMRGAMKYAALPFGLILLGMALNAEVKPSGPLPVPAMPMPLAPPPPTTPIAATTGPEVSASAIASALQKGAESGKYAVRLGNAKAGAPLYVFEDPLCPHCQEFAPTLDALAKQRPVYIFPVSVIGGAASKALAAKVICEASSGREAKWNQALHGVLSAASGTDTAGCGEAGVAANDEIFAMMGLRFTPTVFDATGRMLPPEQDMSPAGIDRWLTKG